MGFFPLTFLASPLRLTVRTGAAVLGGSGMLRGFSAMLIYYTGFLSWGCVVDAHKGSDLTPIRTTLGLINLLFVRSVWVNRCNIPPGPQVSDIQGSRRLADMVNITLINSDIVTAFDDFTIGSKVTNLPAFWKAAEGAIQTHDFSKDRIPGQGFLVCPEMVPHVSAGDGPRTNNPADYAPALHRGRIGLYLKRHKAGEVKFCAVVVYTKDAYLKDPDVTEDEAERIVGATHVLVAVIASSGPESPLPPYRFVHNLAGGNREAQEWSGDEIRGKAKEILAYWNEWEVVAG